MKERKKSNRGLKQVFYKPHYTTAGTPSRSKSDRRATNRRGQARRNSRAMFQVPTIIPDSPKNTSKTKKKATLKERLSSVVCFFKRRHGSPAAGGSRPTYPTIGPERSVSPPCPRCSKISQVRLSLVSNRKKERRLHDGPHCFFSLSRRYF